MAAKYFLDLDGDDMRLETIEERDTVYEGKLSDAGIYDDPDEMWQEKLDEFFERRLGIDPADWVIG